MIVVRIWDFFLLYLSFYAWAVTLAIITSSVSGWLSRNYFFIGNSFFIGLAVIILIFGIDKYIHHHSAVLVRLKSILTTFVLYFLLIIFNFSNCVNGNGSFVLIQRILDPNVCEQPVQPWIAPIYLISLAIAFVLLVFSEVLTSISSNPAEKPITWLTKYSISFFIITYILHIIGFFYLLNTGSTIIPQ